VGGEVIRSPVSAAAPYLSAVAAALTLAAYAALKALKK
jgi:hypothetical protein